MRRQAQHQPNYCSLPAPRPDHSKTDFFNTIGATSPLAGVLAKARFPPARLIPGPKTVFRFMGESSRSSLAFDRPHQSNHRYRRVLGSVCGPQFDFRDAIRYDGANSPDVADYDCWAKLATSSADHDARPKARRCRLSRSADRPFEHQNLRPRSREVDPRLLHGRQHYRYHLAQRQCPGAGLLYEVPLTANVSHGRSAPPSA